MLIILIGAYSYPIITLWQIEGNIFLKIIAFIIILGMGVYFVTGAMSVYEETESLNSNSTSNPYLSAFYREVNYNNSEESESEKLDKDKSFPDF